MPDYFGHLVFKKYTKARQFDIDIDSLLFFKRFDASQLEKLIKNRRQFSLKKYSEPIFCSYLSFYLRILDNNTAALVG